MPDSNPAATAEHLARRAAIKANPLVHELDFEPEIFVATHRIVVREPIEPAMLDLIAAEGYRSLLEFGNMSADRHRAMAVLQADVGVRFFEGPIGSAADARSNLRAAGIDADFVPYLTLAPHDMGPSGPPRPAGPQQPGTRKTGVFGQPLAHLMVLDTGLPSALANYHPGDPIVASLNTNDPADPVYEPGPPGNLDEVSAAGHGLFVAAIAARNTSPSCDITVFRSSDHILSDDLQNAVGTPFSPPFGTLVSTVEIATDITSIDTSRRFGDGPVIVNMSFGGYLTATIDSDWFEKALVGLTTKRPGSVLVAAAGNKADFDNRVDGTRPIYPAAYCVKHSAVIVSVGALKDRNTVAAFSGRGTWVTAWALGVDITAEYVPGTWTNKPPRPQTNGGPAAPVNNVPIPPFPSLRPFATWSGTSFAAPLVAAAIARKVSDSNVTPERAWEMIAGSSPHDISWVDPDGATKDEAGVVVA